MPTDPELVRFRRKMNTARREIERAVERASKVDLRPGHIAEARRITITIRDECDQFIQSLDDPKG